MKRKKKPVSPEMKSLKSTFIRKSHYYRDRDALKYAITNLEKTSIRSNNLASDAEKINRAIDCRTDIDFLMREVAQLRGIVAKLIPGTGIRRLRIAK